MTEERPEWIGAGQSWTKKDKQNHYFEEERKRDGTLSRIGLVVNHG